MSVQEIQKNGLDYNHFDQWSLSDIKSLLISFKEYNRLLGIDNTELDGTLNAFDEQSPWRLFRVTDEAFDAITNKADECLSEGCWTLVEDGIEVSVDTSGCLWQASEPISKIKWPKGMEVDPYDDSFDLKFTFEYMDEICDDIFGIFTQMCEETGLIVFYFNAKLVEFGELKHETQQAVLKEEFKPWPYVHLIPDDELFKVIVKECGLETNCFDELCIELPRGIVKNENEVLAE